MGDQRPRRDSARADAFQRDAHHRALPGRRLPSRAARVGGARARAPLAPGSGLDSDPGRGRRRKADRRAAGARLTLDEGRLAGPGEAVDPVELDDALTALQCISKAGAQIVELRFFGGLTEPEAALVLGMSERTVRREWTTARAWLRRHLQPGAEE
ncbi:MAG: hypothetical protein GY711_27840 [bacterium]|nr:hypothetical protein [bacterium]